MMFFCPEVSYSSSLIEQEFPSKAKREKQRESNTF